MGYNFFAYCNDSPVKYVDSTGTSLADCLKEFTNALSTPAGFFAAASVALGVALVYYLTSNDVAWHYTGVDGEIPPWIQAKIERSKSVHIADECVTEEATTDVPKPPKELTYNYWSAFKVGGIVMRSPGLTYSEARVYLDTTHGDLVCRN